MCAFIDYGYCVGVARFFLGGGCSTWLGGEMAQLQNLDIQSRLVGVVLVVTYGLWR